MKKFSELVVGDMLYIEEREEILTKEIQDITLIDDTLFIETFGGLYCFDEIHEEFLILENNFGNVLISTSMDKLLLELEEC